MVVGEVAAGVRRHSLAPYVLDPVMVATSGDRLLDERAVHAIRHELIPLATCITPNLDEAEILVGRPVRDVAAMESAARDLVDTQGARSALVKGGHLATSDLVDVLYDGEMRHFHHRRIDSTSIHGTGCTLSSAIAAHLALGIALPEAVDAALDFVHRAIVAAPGLGAGHGPLNHWA